MPAERPIIICTRGSALALAQSNMIAALCRARFHANEILVSLMLTYVADLVVKYLVGLAVVLLTTWGGLLIVLGTALLVNQVGLSLSLGAFLAGVLLAAVAVEAVLLAVVEPDPAAAAVPALQSVFLIAGQSRIRQKLIAGVFFPS